MRTFLKILLLAFFINLGCQIRGQELHTWRSTAGTTLRAAFQSVDDDAGTITLLVPRTISLSALHPNSRALATRLARENSESLGGQEVKDAVKGSPEISVHPEVKHLAESPAISAVDSSKFQLQSNLKWYEGGTLVNKSGSDWRAASSRNKLASCADIVAAMWNRNNLVPELQAKIRSMDDMKPLAQSLADNLDAAFKPIADPKDDLRLASQDVATFAAILLKTMGWVP